MDQIVAVFGLQDPHLPDSDVDNIAEKSKQYEAARRLIFSLISSKGGRIIGQVHGNEIVTVPIDQSDVLKDIHQRLKDEISLPCSVGVGEDAHQAIQAMEYARDQAPDSIKVYHPDMSKPEELDVKPQDVAVGPDDEIQKSEYIPISDEQRLQVAKILKEVQANKDFFDQMAQQTPEVYAGIVSVVQSLTGIMQGDKEAKEKHVAKMIEKINKQLHSHTQKKNDKIAKEMQREIDRHAKKQDKKDRETSLQLSKLASSKRKDRKAHAQEFASRSGHHSPEFLYRLINAFRK